MYKWEFIKFIVSLFLNTGPFAAVFLEKTSARIAGMVGCSGLAASLAITSITENFSLFFIMYGVLACEFKYGSF